MEEEIRYLSVLQNAYKTFIAENDDYLRIAEAGKNIDKNHILEGNRNIELYVNVNSFNELEWYLLIDYGENYGEYHKIILSFKVPSDLNCDINANFVKYLVGRRLVKIIREIN